MATFSISGTSSSRLSELEKFNVSTDISVKYFTSNNLDTDGLDLLLSVTGGTNPTYQYYIGGITYVDDVANNITSFYFDSLGYGDSNNFDDYPMIKDEKKQNIINNPIIDNNVFITRQETSVFENNYRLRSIRFMTELDFYAGGKHFNIINNT